MSRGEKSRGERKENCTKQGNRRVLVARGVASLVPIERLSERVNIFLNTKHMHILWGPMCVSYPEIYQPYLGARAHARGPGGAPPLNYTRMENEAPWLPESSISRHRGKKRERERKEMAGGNHRVTTIAYRNVIFIFGRCLILFERLLMIEKPGESRYPA